MLNKFVSNGLRWVSNTSRRFERHPSSYTDATSTGEETQSSGNKVLDNRAKAASIRDAANAINYTGSIHSDKHVK